MVVALLADPPVDAGHGQRDQDAGNEAGHEQPADRDVLVLHGVDDHAHRGRNDGPDDGRAGRERSGIGAGVAGLVHHLDHHRARARGVGQGRARNAREQRQRQHVGIAQATAQMADELRREAQQHMGQRAARHQLGRQDEERHGHQRKAVDAGEHFLEHHQLRIAAADEHGQRGRDGQREGHWKAQHEQDDDGDEKGDTHDA